MTRIGRNVALCDDTVLGDGVTLGNNVTIYPGVVVGDGCTVFDGAVLGRPPRTAGNANRPLPPDRPLTQARLERITARSGNAFMEDSLPRAVIRFKQGFGRLIRSKTDTGRVVVLDPRILTARYGQRFLDALPPGLSVRTIE